jgi:hypothetical protein
LLIDARERSYVGLLKEIFNTMVQLSLGPGLDFELILEEGGSSGISEAILEQSDAEIAIDASQLNGILRIRRPSAEEAFLADDL